MKYIIYIFLIFSLGCSSYSDKLPILGNYEIRGNDTVHATIPLFKFTDQNHQIVTNRTFRKKIYLADFMFLNCSTICPKMATEMKKVYNVFKKNSNVLFISHTIDPINDSIPRLYQHANVLKVNHNKWRFVTGMQGQLQHIAEEGYFSIAYPDSSAIGGFTHSGAFILVDKYQHVRGVYDGTNPTETNKVIADIKNLLREQF
jgi:protein SCO1/2